MRLFKRANTKKEYLIVLIQTTAGNFTLELNACEFNCMYDINIWSSEFEKITSPKQLVDSMCYIIKEYINYIRSNTL